MRSWIVTAALLCSMALVNGDEPMRKTAKEALQPFNDLIGSWRGTGQPEGTREEKQRGFWTETIAWEWQFKGDDAWLKAAFDKGKHFTAAELRYLPDGDLYRLKLTGASKDESVFEGRLKERILTLERKDETRKETQRLVVSMIHHNRFVYRYEVQAEGKPLPTRLYQVGATKEGVPFATGDAKPKCIVSGGLGTMKVTYKGDTYYVCCTGCRDAFNDEPEKYIKEYEAKKAKGK